MINDEKADVIALGCTELPLVFDKIRMPADRINHDLHSSADSEDGDSCP
jgi:aspartate/glutamate racemase